MDYQAALTVLGLEDDAELTRDRVRRTYLRKVREHPPERDPEGFRRLREAFEVLRDLPSPEERAEVARFEWATSSEVDDDLADGADSDTVEANDDDGFELPPGFQLGVRLETTLDEVLALLVAGDIDRAVELEETWRAEANDDDHRWIGPSTAMRWLLIRELLRVAPSVAPEVVIAIAHGLTANDIELARPALVAFRREHPRRANDAAVVLLRQAPALFKPIDDALDGSVRKAMSSLVRYVRPLAAVAASIIAIAVVWNTASRQRTGAPVNAGFAVAPAPPAVGTGSEVLLQEIRFSTKALQAMGFDAYDLGSYTTVAADQRCPGLRIALSHFEHSLAQQSPRRQGHAADHLAALRVRVDLLCGSASP